VKKWQQQRRKGELQKTDERIAKSHRQCQELIYLECICDKIMEFQRRECYDLKYMKTKELSWKENQRIKNTSIKDSQGNVTADQRQVPKIWENNITELYD
jgi:hypothetical protein